MGEERGEGTEIWLVGDVDEVSLSAYIELNRNMDVITPDEASTESAFRTLRF